jgi:hypothetical protein
MPSPFLATVPAVFHAASEEDRERFSYGQCMWFALAVHARTGWPLEAVRHEDGSIDHAWVRLPDGRTFDVAGPNGAEDFISDPGTILRLTPAELIALAGGQAQIEDINDAGAVFQRMVPSAPRLKPADVSARRPYFGGFTSAPTSAHTNKYMRGDCGYFALALASLLPGSQLWEVGIGHLAVEDNAGRFWDIRGHMTPQQLWSGLAGDRQVALSRNEVIALLDTGVYGDCLFTPTREAQALRLARQLVNLAPVRRMKP